MKYEDQKKMIEAELVLKNLCERERKKETHEECPFWNKELGECELHMGWPSDWVIPKLCRWAPEEVALVKALKAAGVDCLWRSPNTKDVSWYDNDGYSGRVPRGMFQKLECDKEVPLDDIINEAEGQL